VARPATSLPLQGEWDEHAPTSKYRREVDSQPVESSALATAVSLQNGYKRLPIASGGFVEKSRKTSEANATWVHCCLKAV
jgi:hypothetical protein